MRHTTKMVDANYWTCRHWEFEQKVVWQVPAWFALISPEIGALVYNYKDAFWLLLHHLPATLYIRSLPIYASLVIGNNTIFAIYYIIIWPSGKKEEPPNDNWILPKRQKWRQEWHGEAVRNRNITWEACSRIKGFITTKHFKAKKNTSQYCY